MLFRSEIDVVKKAHALDLLTTPYVFDAEQAADMARAGADVVVCHMGLTTGGNIGASTALKLEDCVLPIREWCGAGVQTQVSFTYLLKINPQALEESLNETD